MKSLRISMILGQFKAGVGGCEQQAVRLAAALQELGHEVEILTTRPQGTNEREWYHGVMLRRLFNFGNRRLLWRLGIYTYAAAVGAELVRSRPDVVHAHQLFHTAFAAVASRPLHGRPVLVKAATSGPFGDLTQMQRGEAFPGCRPLLRVALQADRMVAISTDIREELEGVGVAADRIVNIPNGVQLPAHPRSAAQRTVARRQLDLPMDDEVVLYVGRCKSQKAPDLLLGAWRRLQRRERCHLMVVGDGFQGDPAFRAAAAESRRLHLVGRVQDVTPYLYATDVLLYPSRGEGLSNSLLEALALGVPCVASGIPGNRELLDDGAGLLAPPENALGLAILSEKLLDDEDLRSSIAGEARRRASRFSIQDVARRYQALYAELLQERPPHETYGQSSWTYPAASSVGA